MEIPYNEFKEEISPKSETPKDQNSSSGFMEESESSSANSPKTPQMSSQELIIPMGIPDEIQAQTAHPVTLSNTPNTQFPRPHVDNITYATLISGHPNVNLLPIRIRIRPLLPNSELRGFARFQQEGGKFVKSLTNPDNEFAVYSATVDHRTIIFRCPLCNFEGNSMVKNTLGPFTYMVMIVLGFVFFLLAVIPLFLPRLHYMQHSCPNCNTKIAIAHPA